jgi:hypothetical protein
MGMVVTLSQRGQELSGTVATSEDTMRTPIEAAQVGGDGVTGDGAIGDRVTFEMHDAANRLVRVRLQLTNGRMIGEASVDGQIAKVGLSPATDAGFYPIAGGLLGTRPVLIRQVPPEYTVEAREARVEGTVVLQVVIDPGGKLAQTGITWRVALVSGWMRRPSKRYGNGDSSLRRRMACRWRLRRRLKLDSGSEAANSGVKAFGGKFGRLRRRLFWWYGRQETSQSLSPLLE